MIKVKCLIPNIDFDIERWEAAMALAPEPSWNRKRKKEQNKELLRRQSVTRYKPCQNQNPFVHQRLPNFCLTSSRLPKRLNSEIAEKVNILDLQKPSEK